MKIQKNRHRILKTLKWLVGSLFFLLFSTVIILSLPSVQTYLAQEATKYLSKKSGYDIKIEKLAIKWFDEIECRGLDVHDKHQNHLFTIKSLHVDYQLIKFWKASEINIDFVKLVEPDFSVGWYPEENMLSFSKFVSELRSIFIKPTKVKKPILPFEITAGKVVNGKFTYFDYRKSKSELKNYFDYNYFTLDSIDGDVKNFRMYLDTISLSSNNITAKHTDSHIKIHKLSTNFLYTKQHMVLGSLEAYLGDSYISDSLSFSYNSVAAFSHFNDSVRIDARIKNSKITSKDLQVFNPKVGLFNDTWAIDTEFEGYVRDFKLKDLHLKFGEASYIKGDLTFEGLPEINETFMELDIKKSKLIPEDLRQYLRNETVYQKGIKRFGKINFEGSFNGYINNFVAHGDFDTEIGYLSTDVNFVMNKSNYSLSSYSGDLITKSFNLGSFLGEKSLGIANLNIAIKPGSYGFSTETAKIDLVGDVHSIMFKKYNFKDIHVDASLAKNIFNGEIVSNDPNAKLSGIVNFNLNEGFTKMEIDGEINALHLKELGYSKEVLDFDGIVKMDLVGFDFNPKTGVINIDDLNGRISIDSLNAKIKDEEYNMVEMDFESSINNNIRTLKMKSGFLDAQLKGDFKLTSIVSDFPVLVKEYILFLENDHHKMEEHYASKDNKVQTYKVDFEADLKDVQALIALLDTNIEIANHTKVSAQLQRGESSVFNIKTSPKYFRYKNFEFIDNEIDINSSKLIDSSHAIASVFVRSESQKINGVNYLEQSDLLLNINEDKVGFVFKTNQYQSDNFLYLRGNAEYYRDSLIVNLKNSYLHLLDQDWKINDQNKISLLSDFVKFQDVSFVNNNQLLSVNGKLSPDKEDLLKVKLRDFDVKNLQSFTSMPIGGKISGDMDILNAFSSIDIKSKVLIDDFTMLNDTIGKIKGKIDWSESLQDLSLDVDLIRHNLIMTHAKGHYRILNKTSPLDINFVTKDADFAILEPFLKSYAEGFKGVINGNVHLSGTMDYPVWKGKMQVDNAGFLIKYFKTYYEFSNEIIFDKENIICKNVKLTDSLWKTTATLDGMITHHWFKNYSTNSTLKLKNTFVLNTSAKDNTLYYGSAFGTGLVSIDGPFSNMKIVSKELTSNTGTNIFIPLEEPDNLTKKDYVNFVTANDKIDITKKKEENDFNMSGIDMDINFNVTNDANFEIIFDANAGDVIKGNGDGLINLKIDTRGDFNMFGTYKFNKGSYNFTLLDIINKRFEIQKGGTITWDGDPYQGDLALDAVYEQSASLDPLFVGDSIALSNTEIKRKIPVDIHLGLTGKLMNPDVRFDINFKNYPNSLESLIAETTTKFHNNDQFRNKQVFSLVVLKQFSPEQNIGDVVGGSQRNLSELFTNQFGSWVSQFDENLNVDIELSGFDTESNGIFRVKLDYSLLDGRLRVSRDGSFSNMQSSNELANVFGEWTLEYLITDDGKLRIKAFNKNSIVSGVTASEATTNTTYGISIMHNFSFDNLKELFKKKD